MHIRIHSLHCYIFTNHVLCAPAYIPTLPTNLHTNNPTNAPTPYIPTRPLYTYTTYLHTYKTQQTCKPLHTCPIPAYLHYTYNHYTLLCIPALWLHTSSKSRQSHGAVAFCPWGNTMCCEFYWPNYCIWIWLVYWEPPAEGRGVEFPKKSAFLAYCTSITVRG